MDSTSDFLSWHLKQIPIKKRMRIWKLSTKIILENVNIVTIIRTEIAEIKG